VYKEEGKEHEEEGGSGRNDGDVQNGVDE
jgi:hypothetical protein